MRVGSVQETEQEKGCAHFLEHITFGGTRHFPKRSLVEYLESLGMKYGQDINAFTGFTVQSICSQFPPILPKTKLSIVHY